MAAYQSLTDKKLIDLIKKDDNGAYTEIYNRYHAALYIHVFNKLQNREEARDIVHDLFSGLWEKRHALAVHDSFTAYLYCAARYRVFEHIAHRQVESKYMDSIREFSEQHKGITDHLVREKQLLALINHEIAALPPKMREIFELSRTQHLSHKQIAEKLNLSEKTVKKQVNNSLKILRVKLGPGLFMSFIL